MRVTLILSFLFLFAAILLGRLAYIQIGQHDFYSALAHGQQGFFIKTQGERGEVFFRSGEPLAINRTFIYVFASPPRIENPEETAMILSHSLNLPQDLVLERITQKNSFFELLKNRLTEEEVVDLKKKNLPGIYFGKEILRYYPQDFLASQIIGFVDRDGRGQYGIEGQHNNILHGREGFKRGQRDVWGRILGSVIGDRGQDGQDLTLTLDYNIQFMAENLLQEAFEKLNIRDGQIIVADPISGEILAMASHASSFDPNYFSKFYDLSVFKNPAIQKIFEPGSVIKPFTLAIALEENKITPETKYVDTGKIEIGRHLIRNYRNRTFGEKTMTGVLVKSINTGTVHAAQLIGLDKFLRYFERFGFFNLTGIELQGEVAFHNNALRRGREINLATASFGQGISMTPIQLVQAFSVFANQGRLVRPQIIKNNHNQEYQQVISKETALKVTNMLVETVNDPWGKRAQVPGYYIAGKTGTAQIPWTTLGYNKPGYSDEVIHSFIGFGPAYNPRFLILVSLDNAQNVETVSISSMSIFQRLATHIINLWQIPPDY